VPGTGFESLGVLDDGTEVELVECAAAGSWCAVSLGAQTGFFSGQYLREVKKRRRPALAPGR